MKNNLLVILLLLPCMAAICQTSNMPTPEYDYAILYVTVVDHSLHSEHNDIYYTVEYSSTRFEIDLRDTLKIDNSKENSTESRFKCFKYLNTQGFELVTSDCYPYHDFRSPNLKYEYVFKRPKQVSVK